MIGMFKLIIKKMKKLMMFFALMFALILPVFGQVVEPPTNWLAVFANINVWLGSLAGIAAVTVFLAAAANTLLKTTGFMKQLVAWIIAAILLVAGNLLNMGFMAELNWLHTLVYGLAAGFLANGIFDLEFIKTVLKALKIE